MINVGIIGSGFIVPIFIEATKLVKGYRYVGIILVLVAAFVAMLSLTLFAREGDRDAERNMRRAQRLAIEAETPVEPEVVEEKE